MNLINKIKETKTFEQNKNCVSKTNPSHKNKREETNQNGMGKSGGNSC